MTDLTPREIVSELDRFIIGQKDAKRAVAVALRNRWRRKQLGDDLRDAFGGCLDIRLCGTRHAVPEQEKRNNQRNDCRLSLDAVHRGASQLQLGFGGNVR